MMSLIEVRLTCGCSFFNLSIGLVRVCDIELSHMGKNNGNPNLVFEKSMSHSLNEGLATKSDKTKKIRKKSYFFIKNVVGLAPK